MFCLVECDVVWTAAITNKAETLRTGDLGFDCYCYEWESSTASISVGDGGVVEGESLKIVVCPWLSLFGGFGLF